LTKDGNTKARAIYFTSKLMLEELKKIKYVNINGMLF
jgi:hypothetical protein